MNITLTKIDIDDFQQLKALVGITNQLEALTHESRHIREAIKNLENAQDSLAQHLGHRMLLALDAAELKRLEGAGL